MKKYIFLESQLKKILNEAKLAVTGGGREIAGMLIDNGYFIELIQTRNKIKKGGGFAYYYKEVRSIVAAAEKLNHEVIGTFHSHSFYIAKPGENDIVNAVDDSIMLIIDATDQKIALWHIKNKKIKKVKISLLKESKGKTTLRKNISL